MSHQFRELLKKVGSGTHTSKQLTRQEAALATRMMLQQEATPAQIGAFLIAHRIRRPTSIELAGILDAYGVLGPRLSSQPSSKAAMVFGLPYDGRSRTAPAQPLVALLLATMGCPVVLHGSNCMPTKYGLPLIDIWQGLGIDWMGLSLAQVQAVFQATGVGFLYLPEQFPLAQGLVPYREQIGKRPPMATAELMWCPYAGDACLVSGYVHPPTEGLLTGTLDLQGIPHYLTVKGLEGSSDLPRARTAIIGIHRHGSEERLLLHAREYGLGDSSEFPLSEPLVYIEQLQQLLRGAPSPLMPVALWNGGFYLWQSGLCSSLEAGIAQAETLLVSGQVQETVTRLCDRIAASRRRDPLILR
ncbi:Anthranilate phosphoribosyltransferase [Halomicronema hongdechloris C2206]|uniref:Anthranilate phosphoribosyltransferase n=1 Tax=Halomicronema hongdechloris C2206 TaxID=1641165 RepID=A0A1Z3HPD2_9CYAN|nr:anthranilate phosphoribosyltransferase family protein [Halomicronema hongdechloris]ASC72161.1 Anthranilate phosphoribosyltransferase [Halomicronema hongdechloris C2206]